MPLIAVDNRRLYRQIADQIAALIEKGEYGAGQRLLPERDLARQLGVSRPSVREALIALEVEGYVEVREGSGVYLLGADRQFHLRVEAIGRHDAQGARNAMRRHMDPAARRFSKSWDKRKAR